MLFLLFQLGGERYALEVSRVVEVLPLLSFKQFPHAPPGIAGVFNYRGRPVPALDLCALTHGRAARERLSTRIIVINYPDGRGTPHLLGLIAENATRTFRKNAEDFSNPGLSIPNAPYLGPILLDEHGAIQWIREQQLLPEPVRETIFTGEPAATHVEN
jgi:chemotaxis-related protein WspB